MLVLDDSVLWRNRSKAVELLAKVYDHVFHEFVRGFNLSFRYEGWNGKSYTLRNSQDKPHFLCALSGELEFSKGWFVGGEAQLLKGAHDKDVSAAVQFKRVW